MRRKLSTKKIFLYYLVKKKNLPSELPFNIFIFRNFSAVIYLLKNLEKNLARFRSVSSFKTNFFSFN